MEPGNIERGEVLRMIGAVEILYHDDDLSAEDAFYVLRQAITKRFTSEEIREMLLDWAKNSNDPGMLYALFR